MKYAILICLLSVLVTGCATVEVSDANIQAAAATVDYGNSSSETLVTKAWEAAKSKKYPELFAYTNRCVELYSEQGKRMNAALTAFEPPDTAAKQWALNDVGTCLYIMATAYVELEMYPQAAKAYRTLADDFNFAQCWDPKGWYWQPAATADYNANKYRNWH